MLPAVHPIASSISLFNLQVVRSPTMSTDLIQPGIAGALFGSGLTASGVYFPGVILAQMELRNFHMLKVFLSASCLSA